jgi:hypothetical protein
MRFTVLKCPRSDEETPGFSGKPSRLIGVYVPMHRTRGMARFALLLLIALLLGGCGLRGSASPPAPTPSPTPAPVQVALTVAQQGRVDAHTLKLIATMTVTNHLTDDIGITQQGLYYPRFARFDVYKVADGTEIWDDLQRTQGCPFCDRFNGPILSPGSSQTWMPTLEVSSPLFKPYPGQAFQSGVAYRVVATVFWHTGPLPNDANEQDKVLKETDGEAQITLT